MKKTLLTCGAVVIAALSQNASAQLALENFNSGTVPAGWVMISDGHTVSTSFTGVAAIQSGLNAAAWMPYQVVATGNYSMITTSYFNPAATADRWLITPSFTVPSANTILKWDDYDLNSGENIQVLISPTAGTTAAAFSPAVYDRPAGTNGTTLQTHAVSLSSFNGQTIRVAFRDHVNDGWGLIVDNVATGTLPNLVEGGLSNAKPGPGSSFAYGKTGNTRTLGGTFTNNGAQSMTSFVVNYKQGAGPVVSQTFTSTTPIQPMMATTFQFTTPFTIPAAGTYPIKMWISLSGDPVASNDTLNTTIIGLDSLQPRMVLLEEFNNASCDPCAAASPNVDSVIANNLSRMNAVRYHVWYPGRDCMDSVTKGPFVGTWANTYYAVTGVPDAKMNGYLDVYPGKLSSGNFLGTALIASEASAGSPFKLTPHATYNAATHTYSISADIKAYTNFAAGLKLRAVLTIDTIKYTANQSQESIPQFVFPQVAENMFAGTAGTALGAFTTNQTQTLNLSWVKDHPWASNRTVWVYDSTSGGHVTFWVQDDATKNVYQSASIAVSTNRTTGVTPIAGKNGSMSVYPNPFSQEATVSVTLTNTATVSVEMFDMTGKKVYSIPAEKRNAGASQIDINASTLSSGSYFVNVKIDGETITQKVVINK